MATKIATGTWSDIKAKLAEFDRADLLKVVQDLYAASKENQAFLHARFCLGDDVIRPCKMPLARWLWPDVIKNQDISVAKAKEVISDYKKAIGLHITQMGDSCCVMTSRRMRIGNSNHAIGRVCQPATPPVARPGHTLPQL